MLPTIRTCYSADFDSPRTGDTDEPNTFQMDEDAVTDLNDSGTSQLKVKNKRRKRKCFSTSFSQPRFSDSYMLTDDPYLGCGSYGSVFQCTPITSSAQAFAVKVVEKKGHSRTRMLAEIEILHQCKGQPNIIQLLEFFEEEDRYLLVFEKMNGGPLLDHIADQGLFSEREASAVVRDIAQALDFLHQKGIAHRDLKPANILCFGRESATPVKICDFDLASAPWTREGNNNLPSADLSSPVGSAEYMAPEVVNLFIGQAAVYDKRCDMWSLGVILYILLCGYPPFVGSCGMDCGWNEGENCNACQASLMESIRKNDLNFPESSWGHISEDAKHLVSHLLERDADKRFCPRMVLEHPWVKGRYMLSAIPLDTPCLFQRTNSATYMAEFADHLVATNRVLSQAQIIHEQERPRLDTEDSGFGCEGNGYHSSSETRAVSFSLGPFDLSDEEECSKSVFQPFGWVKGSAACDVAVDASD
jgi:MAP kinase interacting serine/threonine kinase